MSSVAPARRPVRRPAGAASGSPRSSRRDGGTGEASAIDYTNTRDFLYLPEKDSARRVFRRENIQGLAIGTAAFALLVLALSRMTGVPAVALLSGLGAAAYLGLFIFKVIVVRMALRGAVITITPDEIAALAADDLPTFSILIPLYQEAGGIPQLVEALSAIDYPAAKLETIITLEAYDSATIEALARVCLPSFVRTLILPNVAPKTKPKALNVAFPQVTGEFLVIYDAEIVPEPAQLKKAALAFSRHPDVACLQVKLDHFNARQSWITRLFNAEFCFYYDLFLPGLQRLGVPMPLSGHSSLYRTDAIRRIGAWDPYNVAEDCDLGIRLDRHGYRTAVLDSYSLEEATATPRAWINQRSRWIKGFLQTALVHLRDPLRLKRDLGGWGRFAGFLVVVPGSVLTGLLNLVCWAMLGCWAATRSPFVQSCFPGPVLYVSVFSFVAGNCLFTYMNMISEYRRRRFDLVRWSLLSPVYWLLMAIATAKAMAEVVYSPHHWSKTVHGCRRPVRRARIHESRSR